jgi:DNA-binding IclR family transcriptional regulator
MTEPRVESVERALSLIEAFSSERAALSLAQLAEETGLYKSTILRLAASLIRFGYLRRGSDGRYRLGPALWRLGSLYRRGYELGERIRPALRRLVTTAGETASFYVIDADERLCLYRENATDPLRHHLEEGSRLSLRLGAAGHVLSAHGKSCTEARGRLRPDGGCISWGERNPHICALAVPVFDSHGHLQGALALSGPRNRLGERDIDALFHALQCESSALS